VRVNRAHSETCARDLDALAGSVLGLRIPKVESGADVGWVAERAPDIPLDCTLESARGVITAFEIASAPACALLSYGGLDLAADLGISAGDQETLFARSYLVTAARAAGKPPPSDGVHPLLEDEAACGEKPRRRAAWVSSASRQYIRASCRSSTRSSPPRRRSWPGRLGC